MMENSKPWYYRVIALFCALLICSCLVVFSFMVPHVKATSIMDEWEDYIDGTFFEGSAAISEEIAQTAAAAAGPVPAAVLTGVMLGLNMVETNNSGAVPVNTLTSCLGYYHYGGDTYLCSSVVGDQQFYEPSDGGLVLAESPHFTIHAAVSPRSDLSHVMGYRSGGWIGYWYCSNTSSTTLNLSVTGGGTIFPIYNGTTTTSDSNPYESKIGVRYKNTTNPYAVPFLQDNLTTSSYVGGYSIEYIAGGFGSSTIINWSDMGFDNSVTVNPSNIFDFVINTFNPWVEDNYPDLTVYLFYPSEDATENTDSSGNCNCNHNIYVDVTCYYDPEINVYVTEYITIENNVDVELPSDWLEDYTLTTDPYEVETIPFPTDDSSEPVTMPTLDIEDYEETYGNAIDFWFYVAQSFIEKLHLQLILAFAFALSVAGFVLWKLGGGGKE